VRFYFAETRQKSDEGEKMNLSVLKKQQRFYVPTPERRNERYKPPPFSKEGEGGGQKNPSKIRH